MCDELTLFGGVCTTCARRAARTRNKAGRDHRRYVRLMSVIIIKIDSDECGICLEPLTNDPYPAPLSTTIGHEPPLSVAARDGWLAVIERPEHKVCNLWKGSLTDDQIAGRVGALGHIKTMEATA